MERSRDAYWVEHAKFAGDHGVNIAVERVPRFVAYNPETMLRLRSIAGPSVGCNYDPSQMFWQSLDPIAAIRVLGDAILHVHAKDTQMTRKSSQAICRLLAFSTQRRTLTNAPKLDLPYLRLQAWCGLVGGIHP